MLIREPGGGLYGNLTLQFLCKSVKVIKFILKVHPAVSKCVPSPSPHTLIVDLRFLCILLGLSVQILANVNMLPPPPLPHSLVSSLESSTLLELGRCSCGQLPVRGHELSLIASSDTNSGINWPWMSLPVGHTQLWDCWTHKFVITGDRDSGI